MAGERAHIQKDTGLHVFSIPLVAKWERIGNNVEIIINDNFETSIDIHTEFDFLNEKALNT